MLVLSVAGYFEPQSQSASCARHSFLVAEHFFTLSVSTLLAASRPAQVDTNTAPTVFPFPQAGCGIVSRQLLERVAASERHYERLLCSLRGSSFSSSSLATPSCARHFEESLSAYILVRSSNTEQVLWRRASLRRLRVTRQTQSGRLHRILTQSTACRIQANRRCY